MLKVGLTGGIACGKTHVGRRLAARGHHVLDLDAVAHELTAPGGAAYDDVVRAFGPGILGAAGVIDRRALGARVFADRAALARLNALVHPRVREEEARRGRALAGTATVLVTEAALLVESGLHLRFDRLVVVDCRPEQQIQRLAGREGMTEETARARIAAQMPVGDKRGFAHFIVDGSRPFEETDRMADVVADQLQVLAATPPGVVKVPDERALGAFVHGPRQGPRGLDPAALLHDIVDAGGLEMERLAGRLSPAAMGPWYRAASEAAGEPGPETLAVPLALFALSRRGDDPEFTASVAASVARLTHREPAALADATLMALALTAAAVGGLQGARGRWPTLVALAERWGGGAASARVGQALELALGHATGAAAARAAPDPVGPLAGALAGLAAGLGGAPVPPTVAADVAELLRTAG